MRLFDGDAHVASELRALVRQRLIEEHDAPPIAPRTVGELRARAEAIRHARERAEAERVAAEQKRREEEAEQPRRTRLDAIERRGESVWREIDADIERRNAAGYDRAAPCSSIFGRSPRRRAKPRVTISGFRRIFNSDGPSVGRNP